MHDTKQKTQEVDIFRELMNYILQAIKQKPDIFPKKEYWISEVDALMKGSEKRYLSLLSTNSCKHDDNENMLMLITNTANAVNKVISFFIIDVKLIPTLLQELVLRKDFFIENGINQKIHIKYIAKCSLSDKIIMSDEILHLAHLPAKDKLIPIDCGWTNNVPIEKRYSHEIDILSPGINIHEGKYPDNIFELGDDISDFKFTTLELGKFLFSTQESSIKKYLPELSKLIKCS